MIVDIFLFMLYLTVLVMASPILALPNVSISSSVITAITDAGGYLKAIDEVVPISTVLTIFGLVLSIEAGVFVYKLIMWVIHRIPAQGGGSPN